MQCVVDTELHNAPRAFDAELSRSKIPQDIVDYIYSLSEEECFDLLQKIKAIVNET